MVPSAPVIRAGVAVARRAPGLLTALARLAGSLGWWVAPGRRRIILENVAHLAPGAAPGTQRAIARCVLPNLLTATAHLLRLPALGRAGVHTLLDVVGAHHLDEARALGRGVILVTGHLGPYELGAAWVAARGYPVSAMVEDLTPETGAALATYRTATGVQLISRNTGARQLYRCLKEGNLVALVADRVVGVGAPGVRVPYGDADREIPSGPAAFAVATGAPIVVGHIVRQAGRPSPFVLTFEAPIDPAGHSGESLTRVVGARLAAAATAHPDQWYVFQPAWLPRDAG